MYNNDPPIHLDSTFYCLQVYLSVIAFNIKRREIWRGRKYT